MFKEPADILEALKERTLSVAKLSRETGIPDSRMYKWRDRGSKITAEDYKTLEDWIAKLDNSPMSVAENVSDGDEYNSHEKGYTQNQVVLRFLEQQKVFLRQHDELIATVRELSATNAYLVKKDVSSNESGQVSSPVQEAGKGNRADLAVLPLSGKIKAESPGERKEKQKGILKSAGK